MEDEQAHRDPAHLAAVAQRAHECRVRAPAAVGILPQPGLAVPARGAAGAVQESGKETPSPASPPLRTGLESFLSSGSSLVEVPCYRDRLALENSAV